MARSTFGALSKKISYVLIIGILTTFAGMGTAMASPDDQTGTTATADAGTTASDDPDQSLTMPVPSLDPDTSEQIPADSQDATSVADEGQVDSGPDQGIVAADDEIPAEQASDDVATRDIVDVNQIPNSGNSLQNPEEARNPEYKEVGTPVPHEFDVVVANIYLASEQLPGADADVPQPISTDAIAEILKEAADWWSEQTGLVFTFNLYEDNDLSQPRVKAINTTCTNENREALAAYGHPFNAQPYTDTNKDLLILEARNPCGSYSGVALTVAYPGNVAQGGIFRMWTAGWTGNPTQYDYRASVVAHEFGHTIGLLHSNIRDCASLSLYGDDTIGLSWNGTYLTNPADCTLREYADTTTIMAAASTLKGAATLNALQRWYLGVPRNSTTVVNPNPGVTPVTLARADSGGPYSPEDVTGAVVPFTTDDYTLALGLEYRWPTGNNDSSAGVYITYGLGDTGMQSDVIVPVVGSRGVVNSLQQPLKPGEVAVSSDGQIKVEVISQTTSNAVVRVTIGSQPGVSGGTAIVRSGRTLNALAASMQATTSATTYRWLQNGNVISGATSSSYTPPADAAPNTVYRVEATMSGPGRGPTTRYSRGVMTDPQTFTIEGDTARFVFLDQNGNPVPCGGGVMGISVYTPTNAFVTAGDTVLQTTDTIGVCQAQLDPRLIGTFKVTAAFPDRGPSAPMNWLSAYWTSATTQWTHLVPGTTASLFVGRGDYLDSINAATPTLVAGVDQTPLQMTVSVSDIDGQPVPDVPVTFNVPAQLVVTPASSSTDENGFAYAQLVWNTSPTNPIPETSQPLSVSATVGGIPQVAGSPSSVMLLANDSDGHLEGVFANGETSATADGSDPVTLYVRAWDEGTLVENQPDRIQIRFSPADGSGIQPTISDPVWDPANLRYVVTITSDTPIEGGIVVVMLTDGGEVSLELDPVVTFVPGDPVDFVGESTSVFAAPVGGCRDGTRQIADVYVSLVDEYGNSVTAPGAGVTYSLPEGSPLRFLSNISGLVLVPNAQGQYHISVASSLAGTFDVIATLHGTLVDSVLSPLTVHVTFGNNSLDTTRSSVTVSSGTKLADGDETQTVTATLVSLCGAPMTNLASDGKEVAVRVSPDTGIAASALVEDPANPGTYTATIASTEPGTYNVSIDVTERPESPSNQQDVSVTTAVAPPLSVQFVPPPTDALPPIVQPTNGSVVYGSAEPGVTVRVRNYDTGVTLPGCRELLVGEDGTFSCPISPRLPDGTKVGAVATGVTQVVSDATIVIVHQPFATTYASPVSVGSTQQITGFKFNPGESVSAVIGDNLRTMGPVIADPAGTVVFSPFTIDSDFASGSYDAVLTGETTGDVSISFTVVSIPPAPVLLITNGTRISGTADLELTIQVKDASGVLVPGCESVPVSENGSFSCTPTTQLPDLAFVTVTAVDTLGTSSAPASTQVHAASVALTPSVEVGATQQIIGRNFNPGESVTALVEGVPYLLGPITADSTGTALFTQFTVESDIAIGAHGVDVAGPITGTVHASFTVTSGSSSSASATSSSASPTSTTTSPTSSTTSPTSETTSPTSSTTSPTGSTTSPTSSTTSPTSSTTSPTGSTTSPTGSTTSPTGSTTSPTGSTTSPTGTTTSPTGTTTGPTAVTTSQTGMNNPTESTTSPTESTTSPTGTTTSPTSSTTSPTESTTSPTSSTTSPTESTTSPTSTTTSPTSETSSTSATASTGPTGMNNPTGTATNVPATSAVTATGGALTSPTVAPPSGGAAVATGGLAENKTAGVFFLVALIAVGGFALARTCRPSRR